MSKVHISPNPDAEIGNEKSICGQSRKARGNSAIYFSKSQFSEWHKKKPSSCCKYCISLMSEAA